MSKTKELALEVKHLAKIYKLKTDNSNDRFEGSDFWALRDLSFKVYRGDVIGIIGNNGSGKSTLLKILSQITKPSSGEAIFYGTVTSILEIGTNFHPDLTGRENVKMHLRLSGAKKTTFATLEDNIHAFSEIGSFFDQQVKIYSSGMFLRLAFSVAFHLSSDILLLDEVLAVGDEGFRLKCNEFLQILTEEGRTILFVSHSRAEIIELSTKCLWLEDGEIRRFDNSTLVLSEYFSKHRDNYDQKKLIIDHEYSNPANIIEKDGTINISWEDQNEPGNDILAIKKLSVSSAVGNGLLYNLEPIEIKFVIRKKKAGIQIGAFFFLQDVFYQPVLVGHFLNNSQHEDFSKALKDQTGVFEIRCIIPANLLMPGKYYLFPRFGMEEMEWNISSEEAFRLSDKINFTIHPSPSFLDLIGDISKGSVRPLLQWEMKQL
jgi:lipopolysaccharide transport system ATP-binding protein